VGSSSIARRVAASVIALFLVVGVACSSDEPEPPTDDVAETPEPDPICPLTGANAAGDEASRPAVAVKIENSPAAYPLSGLGEAEVVFEELVEGGMTRFMAIYHCTDTKKAGPVRSARIVDPPIVSPFTRILAAAGGNAIVRKALDKANIVTIDEDTPGGALRRISRPGISSEHTLYGDTEKARKVGSKKFDDVPQEGIFLFGDAPSGGRPARTITLNFTHNDPITYKWAGGSWTRSQHGAPLDVEGPKVDIDNLIIELHKTNYSKKIVDPIGNPSIEIADPVGSGEALVFRDGKVFEATWSRKAVTDRVVYETKDGDEIALKAGTTWIALLPNSKGEVKGSFQIAPSSKKGSKN
jgi:hypothetical protein